MIILIFKTVAIMLVYMALGFVLCKSKKASVVLLAMTPSGAIIESLAELHECEQEFAANVVLLTTILSVITIPVMAFILV